MLTMRSLAIAAATVSLGVVFLLWERRRRRRRLSTGDVTVASACATSGRSSAALSQPAAAPTGFAAVADNPQHHIRSLDDAIGDAQSKFKECASKSSAMLTDVTASRQSVTDDITDGEVIVSRDEEDLVLPTSVEQFFTSETAQTGEENLATDSLIEDHSYCLPPDRAAGGSVESVTSEFLSFSSYEVLSSPNERVIAEDAYVDSSHDTVESSPAGERAGDTISVKAGATSYDSVPGESMTGGLLVGWVQIEQQQEQFTDACLQCGDNLPKHCFSTLVDAVKTDADESVIPGDTGLDNGTDVSQHRAERDQSSGTFDVNSGSVQEVDSISVDSTTIQDDPSLSVGSSCSVSMEIVRLCNGGSAAVELGRLDSCQMPMASANVTDDVTERDEKACMLNVETDCPLVNGSGMQNVPDILCEKDEGKKSEHVCSSDESAASAYSEVPSADHTVNCSEPGVSSAAAYIDHGLRQFAATGDAAEVTLTLITADAPAVAAFTIPLDAGSSQHEELSSERASWSESYVLSESHATSVRSAGECSSPSNDSVSLTIANEKCVPTDINELHVTVSSNSVSEPHCADTFASDAVHSGSSLSFVSTSAASASSDALSVVANAPEHLNGVKAVVTSSVQNSVGRQLTSELQSGDSRQSGDERVFKFYLPTAMCGLFIGKKGRNVNQLKAKSGAYIHVEAVPTARDRHLCVVKGTDAAVTKAINAIIERFPQLESELNAELYPLSPAAAASPSAVDVSLLQLQLVPQTPVSVLLSNVAASTRVFVQLPTHPTFTSLDRLTADLREVYSGSAATGELPPLLEEPIMPFSLCAVESEGSWYRGMIIQQLEPCAGEGSCMQLRYLDYGGYDRVPLIRIRQLRSDFLTLPFQAVECSLAHVKPLPGADSLGESSALATLASFTGYLLECINIGTDGDTGLPSVELYANNNGVAVYINHLVSGTGGMEWLPNESPIQ